MFRRRRLIILACLVAIAAIVVAVRRPWEHPAVGPQAPFVINPADLEALNPANLATLRCIIPGGDDCTVTILGNARGSIDRTNFNLHGGEPRQFLKRALAPFIIETVTVERGGKTHKQELNLTIPPGQTREIRITPDGGVEVAAP